MSGLFTRRTRQERREAQKQRQEDILRRERYVIETAVKADAWFRELESEERERILLELPSLPRRLLSMSPERSALLFYLLSGAPLCLAAAGLLAGGTWSVAGLLALVASWVLFRGGERRMELKLAFADPLSSAILSELFIKLTGDGAEEKEWGVPEPESD